MTTKWIKWRIYCNTESAWTEGIIDETTGTPITCFNDNSHTVNTSSPQQLEDISTQKIDINEETTPTGGHFTANSLYMNCTSGVSTHNFSFPIPVSMLSLTLTTTIDHKDDLVECIVAPNTTIGAITSDVTATNTVISVSQTVIDNIHVGYYVNLYDETNNDDLGRVITIDTVNNTITAETAATNGFLASSPTYVQMSVKTINNYRIGHPQKYDIGKDKIGGSYVPPGTIIRVKYTNNGGSSKDFYAIIEYLY